LWKDEGRLRKEACVGRQRPQSKSLEDRERTGLTPYDKDLKKNGTFLEEA